MHIRIDKASTLGKLLAVAPKVELRTATSKVTMFRFAVEEEKDGKLLLRYTDKEEPALVPAPTTVAKPVTPAPKPTPSQPKPATSSAPGGIQPKFGEDHED